MINEKEWKAQFQKEKLEIPKEAYDKHAEMLMQFAKLTDEQKKEILKNVFEDDGYSDNETRLSTDYEL